MKLRQSWSTHTSAYDEPSGSYQAGCASEGGGQPTGGMCARLRRACARGKGQASGQQAVKTDVTSTAVMMLLARRMSAPQEVLPYRGCRRCKRCERGCLCTVHSRAAAAPARKIRSAWRCDVGLYPGGMVFLSLTAALKVHNHALVCQERPHEPALPCAQIACPVVDVLATLGLKLKLPQLSKDCGAKSRRHP